MGKIQIQFSESDYKIYHEYCLKYYQANDVTRKQSIHVFLDLYEKGILILEADDLRPARHFLTGKCDALKRDAGGKSSDGEFAIPLQLRICTDLVIFCQDLEKIYRLIQKHGIVPNYIMILGTFAKVIEETKSCQVPGMFTIDDADIDALVQPLVASIRLRLGTDRNWRSALRELTIIAARFNKQNPDPIFDHDVILLVAPAVVRHFEKGVDAQEIFSLLPVLIEESELAEFESFLNRTPAILREEEDAGIDWNAISGPLTTVANAVAAQRDQWVKERSVLSSQYSLLPPQSIPAPATEVRESGSPAGSGYNTFDIAVGPDSSPGMNKPDPAYPGDRPLSIPPAIRPFLPVIIGITVIVLFILLSGFLSGAFTMADNSSVNATHNSTFADAVTKVTTKATTKATPTPTPKPTTAQKTATPTPTPKVYSASEVGNHLVDIAFGPDNSKIEMPTKPMVAVALLGSYHDSDLDLVKTFVDQFNRISSSTKISTNIDLSSPSDITIELAPAMMLGQIDMDKVSYSYQNFETGIHYMVQTNDVARNQEKTYVNSELSANLRERWIIRGILYEMGCKGESAKYSDSLFYADGNLGNKLSTVDIKALQLLFGKKVENGMTRSQVKSLVT